MHGRADFSDRLSRVKAQSSPARGYKFGCVCSYMAGHYPGILMTGHIGTNTPKFVPPRWGRPRFDPTQTGLCKNSGGGSYDCQKTPEGNGCPKFLAGRVGFLANSVAAGKFFPDFPAA